MIQKYFVNTICMVHVVTVVISSGIGLEDDWSKYHSFTMARKPELTPDFDMFKELLFNPHDSSSSGE